MMNFSHYSFVVLSSIDSSARAGVVSPNDDETPQFGTKKTNSTVMEVQNIITAHAAAQGSTQILAPAPPRQAYSFPDSQMAPVPALRSSAAYPNLAAPSPIAAALTTMLHQHGNVAAKRPRMDPPTMAVTGAMKNQFMANGHGRIKSQAQIDRKREKNRIQAHRTRLRRKSLFESLQKDLMELQRENSALKEIVRTKLDSETSIKLLAECNAMEQLPSSVLEACKKCTDMDGHDCSLVKSSKQNLRKRRMRCGRNRPVMQDVRPKASFDVMDWSSIKRVCG